MKDPRTIPQSKAIVFCSKCSTTDFESFMIMWKTKGMWNHSMLMRTMGKFLWQGIQITEQSMDVYMKPGVSLDFYTLIDCPPAAQAAMIAYINKKISGPWYTQTYDFIGIFGQAIGLPWIHTPGLAYCSVFELSVLRAGAPFMDADKSKIIMAQPVESDPQQMHDLYVNNPTIFNYEGRYDADEGVVV